MCDIRERVYNVCLARGTANVFDILYETNLSYEELRPVLERFVADKVLSTSDGKTYTLIGGMIFPRESSFSQPPQETEAPAGGAQTGACDEDEEDEENTDLRWCILDSIRNGFTIEKEGADYGVSVFGLRFCHTEPNFLIFSDSGTVYLGDRGAAISRLEKRIVFDEEARKQAETVASECGAKILGKVLCVAIVTAEHTFECLVRLYNAMERVLRIAGTPREENEERNEVPAEYSKALEYMVTRQKATILDLHAQFGFSFHMIAELFRWMEAEGFVSDFDAISGERKVLLSLEEFRRRFG